MNSIRTVYATPRRNPGFEARPRATNGHKSGPFCHMAVKSGPGILLDSHDYLQSGTASRLPFPSQPVIRCDRF
jgi:hypothetical protein